MSADRPSRFRRVYRFAFPLVPILLVLGAVGLALAGTSAVHYASTPEFCASCHSMSPHFESWQVSPHAEHATCIQCHSDPGMFGEMAAHFKGINMLYKTLAKIEPTLVMSHRVPNSSCDKCHQMEDEKAKGVMVSHKKHLDKGVSCQDCHFGLVHLANEFKPGDERFHHICLSCHQEQKVVLKASGSTSCTACHGDLSKVTPADHTGDWMARHGKTAAAGQGCGQCHQAASAGPHGPMINPAIFVPAQQGDACAACHKVDMPHKTPYLVHHGTDARAQGGAVCAVCHSPQTPASPKPGHAAANYCANCHSNVTMPHPKHWLSQHGTAAVRSDNPACLTCHSSANRVNPTAKYAANDFCFKCHAGYEMPHSPKFVADHGRSAHLAGISCLVCHSDLNPVVSNVPHTSGSYCASCHDQYQHPKGWASNHGSSVTQACFLCHSQDKGAKNNCTSCHANVDMPHPKNWMSLHGKAAGTSDNPSCQACHSSANRLSPGAKHAANDFCAKCHAGYDMPHTQKFVAEHGRTAHKAGVSCLVCHSSLNPVVSGVPHTSNTYCAACHDQYRHPRGWVASHGVLASESCFVCHSEEKGAKNSCQDCHQGSPGTKKLFHTDRYWFVTHRTAAKALGEATCMRCHAEIKPSCTQCHKGR